MIACYVRVSSPRQKNDSQKAEIMRWLKRHDVKRSSVTWYEDTERGKTLQRPALARLRASIFDGAVNTLVVWKIDRLSRDQRHGINLLADWCERGVRIVSVTQQIDLNGAVGRMVASVLLGLAEIESEYRRERQSAGISVAKARGVYRGRKKGTTKSKPSRAKELRRRGLTAAEVARALGVSERTTYRYLANDTGK
jgi:DNA invertase Pin-like site-specific DNA recombinase